MIELPEKLKGSDWSYIKRFSKACSNAGGKAYLVGGTVRSALLGERVFDSDLEVFGLKPELLEKLLNTFGGFNKVGKSFGIYKVPGHNIDIGLPRKETKRGTGHCGFDIKIVPDLPLAEAAKRRDFTVNALYYDVLSEEILDPLGGVPDLDKRILRHCSDQFREDPLRVLRAMQFAARLEATVASETISICRELTPEGLSAERYYNEWEKLILSGIKPSYGLDFLRRCNWVRYFHPLQAMIECPQDKRWHPEGDVWDHTLHCMDAFAKQRNSIKEDDLIVGLAVLCHDMGKPATTVVEQDKIHSHGHEKAGIKPAKAFMQQIKVSGRLIEAVLPLILCHMRPAMLYQDKSSVHAVRRLARDCGRLDLLLRLFQADSAGRPPIADNSAAAIEWILGEATRMRVASSVPEPIIKGRHLLARGWNSGPEMGRFLKLAYEAQLDGAFDNIEEAEIWLDGKLA